MPNPARPQPSCPIRSGILILSTRRKSAPRGPSPGPPVAKRGHYCYQSVISWTTRRTLSVTHIILFPTPITHYPSLITHYTHYTHYNPSPTSPTSPSSQYRSPLFPSSSPTPTPFPACRTPFCILLIVNKLQNWVPREWRDGGERCPIKSGMTGETGQDLAPPPDIASGGYGRSPSGSFESSQPECPLPTRAVAARRGIAGVFRNSLITNKIREHTWSVFSTCNLIKH